MKNIVLIGLGAVGLTYAAKFNRADKLGEKYNFRVAVNEVRLQKFTKKPPIFNGVEQKFDYVLPEEKFDADLIIISTKMSGLDTALSDIKNFVTDKTRIISLVNGISSEEIIQQRFPNAKVLKSYFIGHSAVRVDNTVTQDGIGEIVMEHDSVIEEVFKDLDINYSIPDDIDYSMWLKFCLNVSTNTVSAILGMNFGELKRNKACIEFVKKVINEVRQIAIRKGIKNTQNFESDALYFLSKMCDDGLTSTYQDILAKRKTEIDIFSGEIIRLGEIYNIPTPYNKVLYDLIKIKEEDNEYSVHSC